MSCQPRRLGLRRPEEETSEWLMWVSTPTVMTPRMMRPTTMAPWTLSVRKEMRKPPRAVIFRLVDFHRTKGDRSIEWAYRCRWWSQRTR